MASHSEFKHTEIGNIPEAWEVIRIGDVCQVGTGGTPNTAVKAYYSNGNIRWMKSADVQGLYVYDVPNRITELGLANSNAVIHPKGSVMIAMSGRGKTRGMTAVLAVPSACSQSVAAIIPNKEILSSEFLHYDLQFRYEEIRNITGSFDRSGLNLKLIREIKIPKPPIREQGKIATILTTVDDAIQKTDEIIAKTQQLKKGLMQELLTRGIGHAKFKQTEIGEVPEEWEVVKLERVVLSYRNGIYKKPEFYGRGVPSIRMFNIRDGKVNAEGAPLLDVSDKELLQYGLKAGDIVVNRVNTSDLVGKAGIVTERLGKATFESKNIRIRVRPDMCIPDFLALFMNTNAYYKQVRSQVKAAIGQSTINQSDLNKVMVPLPPIAEQKKIAVAIASIDNKLDNEHQRKAELKRLRKGLMQILLTGKVRVKVN